MKTINNDFYYLRYRAIILEYENNYLSKNCFGNKKIASIFANLKIK